MSIKINPVFLSVTFGLVIIFSGFKKPIISEVSPQKSNDSILFSFVVTGCNRVDKKDVSAQNPSTANTAQLLRTFDDVSKLPRLPDLFFFAGDMIMGYSPDTAVLASELKAWRALYENSALGHSKIKLIAIPGNHEVMMGKKKPAYADAEKVWLNIMKPYIANSNGPKKNGADRLATDQSQLTYSFDYLNTHFIVLNTDPVGMEASVPNAWIKNDCLNKNKSTQHLFAIGHKPAYPFADEDGIINNSGRRDSLWNILERNKCEAMLSAHCHLYFKSQPHANNTWQIIAGNGGSPLSDDIKIESQKFCGYTLVEIYKSGKVNIRSMGRDLSKDGYLFCPDSIPTTLRDSFEIKLK